MSDNSASTSPANQTAAREPRGSRDHRTPSRLRKLTQNVFHAADLQFRILMLRAQIALRQLVVYTLLLVAAGLAATAAAVFVSIAIFRILATYLGTEWTLLVFAAGYLAAAAILLMLAQRILYHRGADEDSATPLSPEAPHDPPSIFRTT